MERQEFRTIWDIYNEVKKQRDTVDALIEGVQRNSGELNRGGVLAVLSTLTAERMFLTRLLEGIDRGAGMPTEDER